MNSTCSISAGASRNISKCGNKIANYLNIQYFCVPCMTQLSKQINNIPLS